MESQERMTVLHPSDADYLVAKNQLGPVLHNKQNITAIAARSRSAEPIFTPMVRLQRSDCNNKPRAPIAAGKYLSIPYLLHSVETYEYVDFKPPTAQLLWNRYLALHQAILPIHPSRLAVFLAIATEYIDNQPNDVEGPLENWLPVVLGWGINTSAIVMMTTPEYKRLWFTKGAKSWIKHEMRKLGHGLEGIWESSRERVRNREKACKGTGKDLTIDLFGRQKWV